jgi:hypothetical protein
VLAQVNPCSPPQHIGWTPPGYAWHDYAIQLRDWRSDIACGREMLAATMIFHTGLGGPSGPAGQAQTVISISGSSYRMATSLDGMIVTQSSGSLTTGPTTLTFTPSCGNAVAMGYGYGASGAVLDGRGAGDRARLRGQLSGKGRISGVRWGD